MKKNQTEIVFSDISDAIAVRSCQKFLSQKDGDDVRDIGKHSFRYLMLTKISRHIGPERSWESVLSSLFRMKIAHVPSVGLCLCFGKYVSALRNSIVSW